MAKSLKVRKTVSGETGVVCTRCCDVVIPTFTDGLEYWDCPECNLQFDPSSMRAYKKAVLDAQDRADREDYE